MTTQCEAAVEQDCVLMLAMLDGAMHPQAIEHRGVHREERVLVCLYLLNLMLIPKRLLDRAVRVFLEEDRAGNDLTRSLCLTSLQRLARQDDSGCERLVDMLAAVLGHGENMHTQGMQRLAVDRRFQRLVCSYISAELDRLPSLPESPSASTTSN